MKLLETRDVSFSWPGRRVLDGVSIAVAPGERLVVVGPNGSGKSTLLRIASGLLRPGAGSVRLDDEPLDAIPARERARRLAIVPQEERVDFPFTALEVALMGRSPWASGFGFASDEDLLIAGDALREMGVEDLGDHPFPTLSGGEKQRVIVARAFAQQAGLLVFDEPTTSLDLGHAIAVLEAVGRRCERGAGALIVLHDLTLAARYADRIVLLRDGAVRADGPPLEVLEPAVLREALGIEVQLVEGPGGSIIGVVPRPGWAGAR